MDSSGNDERNADLMDPHQQLLDERHAALMAVMHGISERLDVLNGRTRSSEQHIAVLEDRSNRHNAISVSALSAVVGAIIYYFVKPR